MKNGHRRRVSTPNVERAWSAMKTWVDRAKALDYLLHPLHADVLTLLIFSLKMPAGWIALGWMLVLYLLMQLRQKEPRPRKRAAKVRDHKRCRPPKPQSRRETKRKRTKARRKKE